MQLKKKLPILVNIAIRLQTDTVSVDMLYVWLVSLEYC